MSLRKLMQLVKDNQAAPKAFRVQAADDEATIYLYDAIDPYWGVNAADFVQALNQITASTIHLRINSPGGDVFEARTIATAISEHASKVIAHIDGVAASAATYIAIAADEVRMADGAFFMIHNAWTIAYGNSTELRTVADLLDKVDDSIINDYVRKTGKDRQQIGDWMADETWFTAQEALDNGFVDAVDQAEAKAKSMWNLSAYAKVPKALTEKPEETIAFDREYLERRFALLEKQI